MTSWRKRITAAAGCVALFAGTPALTGTASAGSPIHPDAVGPFQIKSVHNHRCLDEPWHTYGAPNGTRQQLWDCYGRGQVNQQWYLLLDRWAQSHNLGTRYLVINRHSGRCLDAYLYGGNGQPVVVWDCDYTFRNANQLWHVYASSSTRPGAIANLNGRIVDADWNRIAWNGTPIQLWDNYGPRNNQSWYLEYNF